uniref:Signal sequence receptor subunit alpha n=1 Tax=Panagrellus redivivus TaxID=6233 RepID=A0A7E4ZY65_PANRE
MQPPRWSILLLLTLWHYFVGIDAKIFVPFRGTVYVISNLPAYHTTLQTVKAVVGSTNFKAIVVPKGKKFCSQLDIKAAHGLVVLVSENNFELCPSQGGHTFLQVLTGGAEAAIHYHSPTRTFTSPRFRADPQMIAQMMKSVFFDTFVDDHLGGGDVTLDQLEFTSRPTLPLWVVIAASVGAGYMLALKFQEKGMEETIVNVPVPACNVMSGTSILKTVPNYKSPISPSYAQSPGKTQTDSNSKKSR